MTQFTAFLVITVPLSETMKFKPIQKIEKLYLIDFQNQYSLSWPDWPLIRSQSVKSGPLPHSCIISRSSSYLVLHNQMVLSFTKAVYYFEENITFSCDWKIMRLFIILRLQHENYKINVSWCVLRCLPIHAFFATLGHFFVFIPLVLDARLV